jgi:rsbT co-antagonist protein RsbR
MANVLSTIQKNQESILEDWLQGIKSGIRRRDLIDDRELKSQAADVLSAICAVPADISLDNLNVSAWQPLKDLLANLSASRATHGFTPSETATFVMSLKSPIFGLIRKQRTTPEELFADIITVDDFIDKPALHTRPIALFMDAIR